MSLAVVSGTALAKRKPKGLIEQVEQAVAERHSYQVPATGTVEVAFSPDEGSENLVLKVIGTARQDIRMLTYSFTSAPVARALLEAKKRGVDIKIVADQRNNTSEDRSGKSRAALSLLTEAGADVRLISAYPIHHDKVLIVDGETVELGSFNYSDAAAHRNSENVLVNWSNPQLAKVYLEHFARNYRQATPYQLQY
ncbi:phospholipase D family protein [Ramlibacter sp. MMS24-I3-19]|uniref:phospholipase D family nuclease n=1 Tax=Ramlibacter sp. MMS24-I3-19 TaxID=3416606 RepID=UPI003CFD408A